MLWLCTSGDVIGHSVGENTLVELATKRLQLLCLYLLLLSEYPLAHQYYSLHIFSHADKFCS